MNNSVLSKQNRKTLLNTVCQQFPNLVEGFHLNRVCESAEIPRSCMMPSDYCSLGSPEVRAWTMHVGLCLPLTLVWYPSYHQTQYCNPCVFSSLILWSSNVLALASIIQYLQFLSCIFTRRIVVLVGMQWEFYEDKLPRNLNRTLVLWDMTAWGFQFAKVCVCVETICLSVTHFTHIHVLVQKMTKC